MASSPQTQPTQKGKNMALQPNTPTQAIPPAPPAPPTAPAAPAAKSKPKRGLDLSGLSDEARAKVQALQKALAEERKKSSATIAAKERAELEKLGVKIAERKTAPHRETGTAGINGDLKVTLANGNATGFSTDEQKAIAEKLKGDGMTLKDLLAQDAVDGFQWFRYRFFRGSVLLNGKSFADIVNKGAA